MFIFSVWDDICRELSNDKKCIRADEILSQKDNSEWIVIKHDVETDVEKALELAKIESKYNLCATYYVQAYLMEVNVAKLKEIQALGHEVTYHYDVLDANNGSFEKALIEFETTIGHFEKNGFNVKTVCPHGNPVMIRDGWSSNKDFFRNDAVKQNFSEILDIVVELPNIVKYGYTYISDAGYGWKEIVNVQDNDKQNNGDIDLDSYKNCIDVIINNDRVILSTHPHRWEKKSLVYISKIIRFKALRLTARVISKITFFKKILSKYYYLAKKI